MSRKTNFYAGPSTLPFEVLEKIQSEISNYMGMGLSLIETSHRSSEYDNIHNDAIALLRELLNIPDNYKVVFIGGGATLQFSMIPMNFLRPGKSCDFVLSGTWAGKAYSDAKQIGNVNVVFDGKQDNYTTLPETLSVNKDSEYVHITSNETIGGLQWKNWPDTGSVPIIADMSSDILSKPVPIDKFGMIYAGAQKNLGPAGVAIAVIRDDLLKRSPETLTAYLNYNTHSSKNSLYNTPPVFPIWALKLVLEYVKNNGGIKGVTERNEKKAAAIYNTIKKYNDFYTCPVDEKYRSLMNIVFRLPDENLEKDFIAKADAEGMIGLKGHRSVGGCRASVYNSMPVEGAEKLAAFMKDFAEKHN